MGLADCQTNMAPRLGRGYSTRIHRPLGCSCSTSSYRKNCQPAPIAAGLPVIVQRSVKNLYQPLPGSAKASFSAFTSDLCRIASSPNYEGLELPLFYRKPDVLPRALKIAGLITLSQRAPVKPLPLSASAA